MRSETVQHIQNTTMPARKLHWTMNLTVANFPRLNNQRELRLSGNTWKFLSSGVLSSLGNLEYIFLNGNKLS